jgi:hypothetical protein
MSPLFLPHFVVPDQYDYINLSGQLIALKRKRHVRMERVFRSDLLSDRPAFLTRFTGRSKARRHETYMHVMLMELCYTSMSTCAATQRSTCMFHSALPTLSAFSR